MQQEIKDLDEKMIKSNDAYEACQEKLISVQKQLKKTQQELKEAKASKEDQSRIMSKRIKFLYENGNMAYMEVIFEANNFQEFLKRADYVSKISKYDSNMFLQLQTTEDKIRMATKSLKQDYQNTKTLTAKAKTEKEKLDQAAAKKKSKLASYQKQLASDKELLAWFEAEEKRQEEMDLASAKTVMQTIRHRKHSQKEYDRKYGIKEYNIKGYDRKQERNYNDNIASNNSFVRKSELAGTVLS